MEGPTRPLTHLDYKIEGLSKNRDKAIWEPWNYLPSYYRTLDPPCQRVEEVGQVSGTVHNRGEQVSLRTLEPPGCFRTLRGNAQSFFLAQKSNQNTWFSATLVFSLVFRWFSAFSLTLCTVVSKKTMRSCFGGFFSLVFEIQATAWFSWSCLHAETRTK